MMALRPFLLLALLLSATGVRADPNWPDYRVIVWGDQKAAGYEALRAVGVDAGKVMGLRTPQIDPAAVNRSTAELRAAGMPYYVENLATDFYAPYHRWTPEHPNDVTWLMSEARRRYFANPNDASVWERQPSLSDEAWIDRIRTRLAETVRLHAPNRPLYYSLGDETGIADLTAAWDSDRSPAALAAFRAWLHGHYASLAALNAQWATSFPAWDNVVPELTTTALQRTDGNFSAWSDFRDFMDHAFAQALRAGTDAVHAADPTALAGIEGAQVPGRGGYDYTRLPHAVDLMEMYIAGGNLAIARSLNPALIVLSTSFGAGPQEAWNIWHDALMGAAGRIVWDDPPMLAGTVPSDRARSLAGTFQALRQGLGAQLLASQPRFDPVAILYSPASQRLQWLLDRRGGGGGWVARTAEVEGGNDDAMRRGMTASFDQLRALAVQPRILSPALLENGALDPQSTRLLILPRSIALSDAAIQAIQRFTAFGGIIVADGPAGVLDAHGRARPRAPLPNFPGLPGDAEQMATLLARAGVQPILRVLNPDGTQAGGVQVHSRRNGGVTLVGVQADYIQGAGPRQAVLQLPAPIAIQNLRGGGATVTDRLPITLDPVVPALFALSAGPLPKPVLGLVSSGRTTRLVVSLGAGFPAAMQVVMIDLVRPDGTSGGSVRVPLSGTPVTPQITFERSDPGGLWIARARDMLGSGIAELRFNVPAP
jgi:hypothetical protein